MQVTHFTEANDEMGETEEINDKHRWDAKDLEKVIFQAHASFHYSNAGHAVH